MNLNSAGLVHGGNRLLNLVSQQDRHRLAPNLEPVGLPKGTLLNEAGKPISHSYFLDRGIASVIAVSRADVQVEVAMLGREGMTSPDVLTGAKCSIFHVIMQTDGHGYRIKNEILQEELGGLSIRMLLARYAQSFAVQMAYTSLAAAAFPIEARMARWILMADDRTDSDDIDVTHNVLASMLNVRRQSVTTAIHSLAGQFLIRNHRGRLAVRNREGLIKSAGGAYGPPEAEYRRLLPEPSAGRTG